MKKKRKPTKAKPSKLVIRLHPHQAEILYGVLTEALDALLYPDTDGEELVELIELLRAAQDKAEQS